jgi:hypothetical protein
VSFESLNAADGAEGERRWNEAGRPVVPTLVVDGQATPVLHISQIAETLGLSSAPGGPPGRDGADAAAVLDAWLRHVREADPETLVLPTPSRGRTPCNLTVNVFHPFELLPAAWRDGEFPWHPEEDDDREQQLGGRDGLLAFAESAAAGWRRFLDEEDPEARDPVVRSPRGPVRFSALVSFQRWHAAYHYRQLVHALGGGRTQLDLDSFDDLVLPREVF